MKRHDSLLLVAREHHDSLVMARRLMTGKGSAGSGWPEDPVARARLMADFYADNLKRHFAAENRLVFPAALECGSVEAAGMVQQLMQEHEQMTTLIGQLASAAAVEPAALAELGTLLNTHVRMEDRQLFPMIEAGLSAERLARLEADIAAMYA